VVEPVLSVVERVLSVVELVETTRVVHRSVGAGG
jgi:hypothetical protein